MYEMAAAVAGVSAGRRVFVDDREPNVHAAREIGVAGLVYDGIRVLQTVGAMVRPGE